MTGSLESPYAQRLLYEIKRTLFVASIVNSVLLAAYVVLAIWAMYRLFHTATLRRRTFWMLATLTMVSCACYVGFVVGTIGVTYTVLIYNGSGHHAFNEACSSIILACLTAAGSLSDALLTYRCWIICGRSRWICIPIVILLAEFVCFVIQDVRLTLDGIVWKTASAKAAIAGLALGLVLNVMLALTAITQLLRARRELRHAALPDGGQHYVEISRLLAAIALAYVAAWAFTLIYRTTFAATIVSVALMSVITLSPLLIALQVGERARTRAASPISLPAIVIPRLSCEADRRRTRRLSSLYNIFKAP